MDCIIVECLGMVIGTIAGFVATGIEMPLFLCIAIGTAGALAGGALNRMAGFYSNYGGWTFYFGGVVVAIGLLAGGVLAQSLTRKEHRV